MNLREFPIIREVFESGAEDRVFDSLLLVGPLLILVIAVVGRSTVTNAVAITYLLFFVAYVVYRGVRDDG